MPTVPVALMTVEEYRRIPEPVGPYSYELHQGELVKVSRPKARHYRLQMQLLKPLEAVAPPGSLVGIEFPFRPLPEHELRVADVAYVSPSRWQQVDPEDNLHGAPELVIEVLSPSNTAAEILAKEQICLENGCLEFWVVDDQRRQVRVTTADGRVTIYKPGQSIPLTVLGGGELSVDSIFG